MKKSWKILLNKLFRLTIMFSPVLSFFASQSMDRDSSVKSFLTTRNIYDSKALIGQKNYLAEETHPSLEGIKVTEHIGSLIDLDLEFVNEEGEKQALRSYFKNQSVLMTVIYYNCPSLCNFHLNGLFESLDKLKWKNYQFVLISMDSSETASLAKEKKENYFNEFTEIPKDQVHFLTGSKANIEKLTDSLGFVFRWDEETEQFAHSPVAYTLSPEGMISRYLYGIEFLPQTLKLALLEAGRGKVGNVIERILLFCYRFDSKENKYTLYAVNLMKAGGILILLALSFLLVPAWVKERKHHI